MWNYKLIVAGWCIVASYASYAQDTLTVEKAIAMAVKENYDLKIARNNVRVAEVESSLLNSGYLPRFTAGGNVNYANEDQDVAFSDGTATSIDGAETEMYSASVTAEYTLFDGMERKFTNERQEGNLQLNEWQERQQIENTIISIYETYYNVAFQQQVAQNLLINIENSRDRLLRSQKRLKYGQGTTLDELNARVDLNNDSISYATAIRDLNNLKRNLNLLLGRIVREAFQVDTTITFLPMLSEEEIFSSAQRNNIQLVLARQNILLSDLDVKINRARMMPKLTGSGSYQWSESQNPPTSFFLSSEAQGLNLGLSLSWNIFDGGATRTRVETAKINKNNREIELFRTQEQVKTEVYNAYEIYTNARYTLEAEANNVRTNNLNFTRTQRQYSLGQVTTIEFRQAQINQLNALNNYARAKYNLKIAEIDLLQLGGRLLE